jgi:hypothetical protein
MTVTIIPLFISEAAATFVLTTVVLPNLTLVLMIFVLLRGDLV